MAWSLKQGNNWRASQVIFSFCSSGETSIFNCGLTFDSSLDFDFYYFMLLCLPFKEHF